MLFDFENASVKVAKMHRIGWIINLAVFVLCFKSCFGVIYHLNESEYLRMPPLYALDEYGSCLVPADGTFCVVRVHLSAGAVDDGLITMIHEYSDNTLKHYNHTYIQRGVCVTSTCKQYIGNHTLYTEEGLSRVLAPCLNESIYNIYGLQGELKQIYYCERKNQEMEVDIGDWIVMGIYIAIVMVNIVGSLYDVIIRRSGSAVKGNKYILSFSVLENWNRLVSAEPEEIRIRRLSGLHGVRVLTIFLMFTAHIMWVNSLGFNDNIQEFEEMYNNAYYQMIFNGLVVVQVFFVMSGFLLVYNLEIHAEKHPVSWLLAAKVWLMRWWRLTPAYAVALLFMTTWLRHVGSGPLWQLYVTSSVVGDCRNYWWAHLLYINNYIADGNNCAIHTWHIATDTQLFCIGLPVYVLTRAYGGRRLAVGLLILLGIALPAAHVWYWDLDGLVLMTPEFYRTMVNDTFHYMHVYGHNNMACYAIGMAAGYLVYRLQKTNTDISSNKVCIVLCWLIIPFIASLFYSGCIFYADGERASLPLRVAYAALQRPLVGFPIALGVVGLAMSLNTSLRSLFEWSVWVVPSRLSYSVYLLHLFIIHAHIGLKHHLGHASTFNMILMHFGVMLLTFLVALPFSLLVEAPLMRLMKVVSVQEQASPEQRKEHTKF